VAAWSEGTGGAFALGNWNYSGGTSHWPNAGYYTYLMEGGAHHRDIVAMGAGYVEMTLCNNWVLSGNFSSVNRQPTLGGKTFYGNTLSSGQAPRDEAWAFRELVWASAILPNALADGTVYGELQFFKDCMADSVGYAVQVLATFVPEQRVLVVLWSVDLSDEFDDRTFGIRRPLDAGIFGASVGPREDLARRGSVRRRHHYDMQPPPEIFRGYPRRKFLLDPVCSTNHQRQERHRNDHHVEIELGAGRQIFSQ
jgi:hypothetical protein